MKKLISVFAALALVGSLAAQKGKKKAPAIPAVPKAPAMPAVAAAAPAMAGAAKGVGLFIEGFGGYTFGMGSSATVENGTNTQTLTTATARKQETQATAGAHFGGNLGYQLMENLGLVAGFHFRNFTGREFSNTGATGIAWTRQTKNSVGIITVGLRPSVNALGGSIYAGAGWAITLPYTETTTGTNTTNLGAFSASGDSAKQEDKYNLGLKGIYAELGYNYNITSNLYVGVGIRGIVNTSDNLDNTTVQTVTTSTGTVTTTTTYKASASADEITAAGAGNTATTVTAISRGWSTKGVTEIGAQVNIGFRF